jgi:hypothetical protein
MVSDIFFLQEGLYCVKIVLYAKNYRYLFWKQSEQATKYMPMLYNHYKYTIYLLQIPNVSLHSD